MQKYIITSICVLLLYVALHYFHQFILLYKYFILFIYYLNKFYYLIVI